MTAHNSFEQPDTVAPRALTGVTVGADALQVVLPKMSVAVIEAA